MPIYGKITKKLAIIKSEMSIKLSRCVDNLTICEIGPGKQIRDIIGLCQIITIRRRIDPKTKKIAERDKIFHLKVLTEEFFKFLNTNDIIFSDNHVINI
jgi:hypothetical protein